MSRLSSLEIYNQIQAAGLLERHFSRVRTLEDAVDEVGGTSKALDWA
jgi:hypothetical protein